MNRNCYYVYMMTNAVAGFTSKYNITQLVYYEETNDVTAAIAREKQIKGWLRKRKLALISSVNPKWQDLSSDWYKGEILRSRSE
jgi:putative endonuclease